MFKWLAVILICLVFDFYLGMLIGRMCSINNINEEESILNNKIDK